MWNLPLVYVHGVVLSTSGQGGDSLAWIQQALLIKTTAHPEKLLPFIVGELDTHLSDFFDTYAVLPGYGAANFDAELQYLTAELFCFLELPRVVCIVKNKRMKIAVTSMENICHR